MTCPTASKYYSRSPVTAPHRAMGEDQMTTTETVKSSKLIGQHVTLEVFGTPCRVHMADHALLTDTTAGTLRRFIRMPCGPIGILEADDGRMIAFDAGFDLQNGTVSIVVPKEVVL